MTRWERLAITPVGGIDPGVALVRGRVAQLAGRPIESPVALPAGAPPLDRVAVALISVEDMKRLGRPLRLLYERLRPFWIGDGTGRAMVRPGGDADVELRLGRPFLQGSDGGREVYLRALTVGEELVVAGPVRLELDSTGGAHGSGGYRDTPMVHVISPAAIYDLEAWEALAAWRALSWHRKLALIMLNR